MSPFPRGPANTVGQLTWTIGAGVRVWWNPSGTWVEVSNINNYAATGSGIDIRVEGNAIGAGTIQFSYDRIAEAAPTRGSLGYRVYTGLQVTGASPAVLVNLIQSGSNYTLTRDATTGDVWRTGGAREAPELLAWQTAFRTSLNTILDSAETPTGGRSRITTVNAVNADRNVMFGSYADGRLDVADFSLIATAEARAGSAFLIHELVEQRLRQVFGQPYLTTQGNEYSGGAHTGGVLAENAVIGATRLGYSTRPVFITPGSTWTFYYRIDQGPEEATVQFLSVTGLLSDARVTRPAP